MKSVLLLVTLVALCLSKKHRNIDFNSITSVDMLNTWIRNRGTYIFQLLNVPADAAAGEELKKKVDLMDPVSGLTPEENIMNSDRIELPDVCDKRWSASELAAVLEKAGEIMTNWVIDTPDAGKANAEVYNNMPHLTAEQFAKFYTFLAAGAKLPEGSEKEKNLDPVTRKPIQYFTAEEGTASSDQLLKEVNQDMSGKFSAVPWLQFWAYMCLNGRITKKEHQLYLSPVDLRPAQSQPAQVEAATQAVNANLPQPVKEALKEPVTVPTVAPATAKNIPPPKEVKEAKEAPKEAPKKLKGMKGKKLINVT